MRTLERKKMSKTTPWNEIKAEYLRGVTPKELAEKYSLKAQAIYDKANRDNWVQEKSRIAEKTLEITQERIASLTNLALDTLCEVINDSESRKDIKVQAAKALLDISGLKNSKQVIEGIESGVNVIINRESVAVESNN